jgi:ubiquinone/menaquinone biosynthesis C-methylase UbiE
MGVRTMARRLDPDRLDGATNVAELERSLREVWHVNRYLGGTSVLLRHLGRLLGGARGDVSLLDVATGAGDVPVALQRWGERRGLRLSVLGVDVNPHMVDLARRRAAGLCGLTFARADGRRLPYADGVFDVAVCNLALHHLDDTGAAQLLRELARVSRRGWVVADLERRPGAYLSARLLARLVWRSPLTRHDGPLSVLRSFTLHEARALVDRAGVSARVYRHFPFRLAVVGRA